MQGDPSSPSDVIATENNKALARRFFKEIVTMGNLAAVDEIFAASIKIDGEPGDREGIKQWVTSVRAAFPDIEVVIDDQVAEGDKVSTLRTFRGTHLGDYITPFGRIPSTGKQIVWRQLSIVRIVDGKCVEDNVVLDTLGLMLQLGAELKLPS